MIHTQNTAADSTFAQCLAVAKVFQLNCSYLLKVTLQGCEDDKSRRESDQGWHGAEAMENNIPE